MRKANIKQKIIKLLNIFAATITTIKVFSLIQYCKPIYYVCMYTCITILLTNKISFFLLTEYITVIVTIYMYVNQNNK